MRIVYEPSLEQLRAVQDASRADVARACTRAVHRAGAAALAAGRASIASGGFSPRWQRSLQIRYYPSGNVSSVNAAAYIFDKIRYASVFEDGPTIDGRPFLWIPLPTVPLGRFGKHLSPSQFPGRLFSFRGAHGPILGGIVNGKRVPLYVGRTAVQMHARFDVEGAMQSAADKLEQFYFEEFEVGN